MKLFKNLALVPLIWKRIAVMVREHPVVITPFLWIAGFEIILLLIIFLAPQPPVSIVLAPVIKAFWGERFLHYPVNIILIPALFEYGRNIMGFIYGVTLTSVGVFMIFQFSQNKEASWWQGIKKSLRMYLRTASIWAILLVTLLFINAAIKRLMPYIDSFKVYFAIQFVLNMGIQLLLIFAIPSIIIENKKLFPSLKRSLALSKKYFIAVLLLVFLPAILFIPVAYLQVKAPFLMERFSPEFMIYVLLIRILITTAIDFAITSSATMLLIIHRENETRSLLS